MIGGPFGWLDGISAQIENDRKELERAKEIVREHRHKQLREAWGMTKFMIAVFGIPMLGAFLVGLACRKWGG